MTEIGRSVSRAHVANVLRHAGVAQAQINEILQHLPEPVDLDRAQPVFERYAVALGELMNRLGASP